MKLETVVANLFFTVALVILGTPAYADNPTITGDIIFVHPLAGKMSMAGMTIYLIPKSDESERVSFEIDEQPNEQFIAELPGAQAATITKDETFSFHDVAPGQYFTYIIFPSYVTPPTFFMSSLTVLPSCEGVIPSALHISSVAGLTAS